MYAPPLPNQARLRLRRNRQRALRLNQAKRRVLSEHLEIPHNPARQQLKAAPAQQWRVRSGPFLRGVTHLMPRPLLVPHQRNASVDVRPNRNRQLIPTPRWCPRDAVGRQKRQRLAMRQHNYPRPAALSWPPPTTACLRRSQSQHLLSLARAKSVEVGHRNLKSPPWLPWSVNSPLTQLNHRHRHRLSPLWLVPLAAVLLIRHPLRTRFPSNLHLQTEQLLPQVPILRQHLPRQPQMARNISANVVGHPKISPPSSRAHQRREVAHGRVKTGTMNG